MDVAIIVATLASLALAVAKSLMEEEERAQRGQTGPPHPALRRSQDERAHL